MARGPNRIRLLREQDSLTLEQLGLKTGIDPSALSRYERSERGVPDHHKLALADHFEVRVAYLMRWDDNGKHAASEAS